jgi:hypothetical protein
MQRTLLALATILLLAACQSSTGGTIMDASQGGSRSSGGATASGGKVGTGGAHGNGGATGTSSDASGGVAGNAGVATGGKAGGTGGSPGTVARWRTPAVQRPQAALPRAEARAQRVEDQGPAARPVRAEKRDRVERVAQPVRVEEPRPVPISASPSVGRRGRDAVEARRV